MGSVIINSIEQVQDASNMKNFYSNFRKHTLIMQREKLKI